MGKYTITFHYSLPVVSSHSLHLFGPCLWWTRKRINSGLSNILVNVRERTRPNYVRAQIFLITCALFCNLFIVISPNSFLFQFAEKIYEWDAKTYSYVLSISDIVNSTVIIAVSPILIKVRMNYCPKLYIIVCTGQIIFI